MYSAKEISKFIIKLANKRNILITPLKLQKLLYFAQGYNLVLYNKPLFKETIERWGHGPVVPEVYQQYKGHERNPLNETIENQHFQIEKKIRQVLEITLNKKGCYTAEDLIDITHEHEIWKQKSKNAIMTKAEIKQFFHSGKKAKKYNINKELLDKAREKFKDFQEDWNTPEMDIYNH